MSACDSPIGVPEDAVRPLPLAAAQRSSARDRSPARRGDSGRWARVDAPGGEDDVAARDTRANDRAGGPRSRSGGAGRAAARDERGLHRIDSAAALIGAARARIWSPCLAA